MKHKVMYKVEGHTKNYICMDLSVQNNSFFNPGPKKWRVKDCNVMSHAQNTISSYGQNGRIHVLLQHI
jgi:hypothetical protein